jgi:hypothetical protein
MTFNRIMCGRLKQLPSNLNQKVNKVYNEMAFLVKAYKPTCRHIVWRGNKTSCCSMMETADFVAHSTPSLR